MDVVETRVFGTGAPDLIIEVPHGATRTVEYTALAAKLDSPLPPDLIDFFYVNTDAGAPELAIAIAEVLEPARTVHVLRSRIPRTFIDCNRKLDAAPGDFRAGGVTPGLMPWIVTDADRALLRQHYDAYVTGVRDALAHLAPGGALLMLHTYAPRSVDVEVGMDIVAQLRRAWQPDVVATWPLRPELDVIGRGADGTSHAPEHIVDGLRHEFRERGIAIADSATYPLHPSTLAFHHAQQFPGRALCLEVRRDLLADPFEPFAEMTISPAKCAALATPIASALRRWWAL